MAAVEVAAHKPFGTVDPDRVVMRGDAAEAKADLMRKVVCHVAQLQHIEIRVMLRPWFRFAGKLQFDEVKAFAVRGWFDGSH